MSNYSEFFLGSKSSIVQLELLEISHSNFSQTYYIVRNAVEGVTVTLETMSQQAFEYYPLSIIPTEDKKDLDFGIKVNLGDLGEVLPMELDNIASNDNFIEKPVVKYRTYRSDDLTAPLFGPISLEIVNLNFNREGASFEAKAPSLNINKTGEIYDLSRFPMLRAFV